MKLTDADRVKHKNVHKISVTTAAVLLYLASNDEVETVACILVIQETRASLRKL